MNRNKSKPTRIRDWDVSSILPEDAEIASRYIQWKTLIDKYDKPCQNDEEGMTIDDLIEMIDEDDAANKNKLPIQEEAYECSDDDDDEEKNSDKFDALQKQVTTALQERTANWKRNGLEQICNSDFSLSVDFVQKWMKECELGTGKQVSKERETRFTEYNGKTQIDVTHRENVSVLHETERKQLTAEHSANYEFNGHDQRRVVVHQVEKTTISSYLTVDPNVSNEAMLQLPLDSFFGNITCYTPFKIPAAIEQFRNSCRDNRKVQQQIPRKINIGSSGSGTLSNLLENSRKLVPISRVEDDLQKKPQSRAPRVRFKPTKKMQFRRRVIETSSSSEQSSSSDSSSRSEPSEKSACSGEKNKKVNQMVKPVHPRKYPDKTKKPSCLSSSTSTSSDNDSSTEKSSSSIKQTNDTGSSSTKGGTHCHTKPSPPSAPNRPDTPKATGRQYPMPPNYRHMLSVNGRCRYKTDGTVIYRPRPNHRGLPRNADKILIQRQDLDLTGIKCSLRRKKFDNFSRQTHPNSVLVYYMSDSDTEAKAVVRVRDSDDSSDDDDPILSFKPELCILTFYDSEGQGS